MPSAELRKNAITKIFERGVILLGSGERSIRFRPALNVKKEHIDECMSAIESVVKEM
jgi:L-lysine 6-transaminase